MELAHLIERAYQQYDCYDNKKPWLPEATKKLVGSTAFVTNVQDLDQNNFQGKVEYEILDILKFTGFWWTQPETVPFGFIAKRLPNPPQGTNEEIFVVFRGTREWQEWYRNFDFAQDIFLGKENLGQVSKGFHVIYTRAIQHGELLRYEFDTTGSIKYKDDRDLYSQLLEVVRRPTQGNERAIADVVYQTLTQHCKPGQCKIFVTGHSLGGAIATLAARHIKEIGYDLDLYTFASPRVGAPDFAKGFQGINCYRIANSEDVVIVVPGGTERIIGDEMLQDEGVLGGSMTKARRKTTTFLDKLVDLLPTPLFEQVYQHIGTPLYFTNQTGAVSSNHNMFLTYRSAIPN
ncbi:lipase family protein [Nostoc sp. CALU 546]|uniref:lipase family protein n=1 Tax=Nostoc sp. CALU 546 TaxID=1867241 RepID=UPI003B670782